MNAQNLHAHRVLNGGHYLTDEKCGEHVDYIREKIADFRHMEDVGAIATSIGVAVLSLSIPLGVIIIVIGLAVFSFFGYSKGQEERKLCTLLKGRDEHVRAKPIEWESRTWKEQKEVETTTRENVEDGFQRIDRLFDVMLLLVTVLAAAELQYAAAAFMDNPDPTRTFIIKLNSFSFVFKILTMPILLLVFIWLGKKFFHNEYRRMFMRELCWAFAVQFFFLELVVFYVVSFSAAVDLNPFVGAALVPLSVLTGLITREYRRVAPTLECFRLRSWMFWASYVGSVIIAYMMIWIVVYVSTYLPTPIPL